MLMWEETLKTTITLDLTGFLPHDHVDGQIHIIPRYNHLIFCIDVQLVMTNNESFQPFYKIIISHFVTTKREQIFFVWNNYQK
jgi:hypothetical protein